MEQWLKTLAGSLCILTILLHLVPQGRFAKYVRFYAGMLFFFLAVSPALELFGSGDELERLLRLEFLREESDDLETAAESMAELKNTKILEAYQTEMTRQVREIALACGLEEAEVTLTFAQDGYTLQEVSIRTGAEADESVCQDISREIQSLYLVQESKIRFAQNGS